MGTSLLKKRIAEISHFAEETQGVVFLTRDAECTGKATQRKCPGAAGKAGREVRTAHANMEGSRKF